MATIQGFTKAYILDLEASLGTASTKNIPVSGNASATEVVIGTDTRLTNTRNTPNQFTLRFDSGITTGTDAFAFNGSTPTAIVINGGSGITLTKGAGTGVITINNSSAIIPAATGVNDMVYATGAGTWARFAPGTGVRTALTSAVTGTGGIALSADTTFTGLTTFANSYTTTMFYEYIPTPTTLSATATLTIAQMLGSIIVYSGGGSATFTLPTAALTDAGILGGALPSGGSFDWYIIHTTGVPLTMAAGGHSYVGSSTVSPGTSAQFRTRKNATSSFTTYRIG